MSNPATIRPYQAGDEHAILATFNRVFARVDPGFKPRTIEEWRWEFRDNPSGARIVLAVSEQGEVLAQYAGLLLEARLDGEPALFCQSVDSMVAPEARAGLGRRGLFLACGEAFRDLYGGTEDGGHAFIYGLPVPAAWRVGRARLEYEILREGLVLVADIDRTEPEQESRLEVEELRRFPDSIDFVFDRAAREHGAIAVRHARHLNWRFADHPRHEYRLACVSSTHGPIAYCVVRFGTAEGVTGGIVCDWLAPDADGDKISRDEAARALRAWILASGREHGVTRWVAAFPEHSREWLEFQRAGWRVTPGRHVWAAHSHDRRFGMRWFFKHYYATLGDTDLV